jgi:hypothetical protein
MPQRVLAKLEEEGGFADELVDAEEDAKLVLAVDHRLTRHRLQPKRARWSAPCSLSVACLFVCLQAPMLATPVELGASDASQWTRFVDTWRRVGEEAGRLNASIHHRHFERLRSRKEGVSDELQMERQLWCLLLVSFALCVAIALYWTRSRVRVRSKPHVRQGISEAPAYY